MCKTKKKIPLTAFLRISLGKAPLSCVLGMPKEIVGLFVFCSFSISQHSYLALRPLFSNGDLEIFEAMRIFFEPIGEDRKINVFCFMQIYEHQ
jgi:hypothetical protein